jgi:hypothetical protein
VDTNGYVDSGASDHITSELEKLTVRDKYHGQDQVHTLSGSGMKMSSIGHTVLHTLHKDLHLKIFFMYLVPTKAYYLCIA